ncbi:MAG: Triose-phosphate isomerase [Deltaproteobacteria bacterium]|nr:Triose-phosphate isomerase [Deltaproteobacteria bacterium]
MRKPILAANWKMHKTIGEAVAFAKAFAPLVADVTGAEIVIAPPFPALAAVGAALRGTHVLLAAQNVHPEKQGAFTGEVSPPMLVDLGCAYAIVGHSERRHIFGEASAFVARKAAALLAHGVRPIVCVGETLEEREAKRTFAVLEEQLRGSLAEVAIEQAADVVIAYEPVWAIGTGRTATPAIAQEAHAMIRSWLQTSFGAAGDAMRIQYGGSVKPDNVSVLMAEPDIDGALVGGASLDAASFAGIVRYQEKSK